MRCRTRYLVAFGAMTALSIITAARHTPQAAAQVPAEYSTFNPLVVKASWDSKSRSELRELYRGMFDAARGAYRTSLDQFKAGQVADPEVVYRWSMRWMQTEGAAGDERAAKAAKEHRQRMEQLADIVKQRTSNDDFESVGPERKQADDDLNRSAVDYYREEARLLLEEATIPSSTRKSKSKTLRTPDGGTVQWSPGTASPNAQRSRDLPSGSLYTTAPVPTTESADNKSTTVFRLKHANAQKLMQTLNGLFGDTYHLQMAIDDRTNILLVHGTQKGIEAVAELINVLDAPGSRPATSVDFAPLEPAPELKSNPTRTTPAELTPDPASDPLPDEPLRETSPSLK